MLIVVSCSPAVVMKKEQHTSLYDPQVSLNIVAENFPEYEWNENAQKANDVFLKGLNECYYQQKYQAAVSVFYSALDLYQYDARIYVRLAESQARLGDLDGALNTLHTATQRLTGFSSYPGIESYIKELNNAKQLPEGTPLYVKPRGTTQKVFGALIKYPKMAFQKVKGIFKRNKK